MEHSPVYCNSCMNRSIYNDGIENWFAGYMDCRECSETYCDLCASDLIEAEMAGYDDLEKAIRRYWDCSINAREAQQSSQENMATFEGGGRRSSDEGKPRFDLLLAPDMPYEEQFLYRFAMSMTEGAQRYGEHNYANMTGEDALNRAKASLFRHVMQYLAGETDEDHAARIASNLLMLSKIEHNIRSNHDDG